MLTAQRCGPWLLWGALVALVVWAYHPGLLGGFEFDDDSNIVRNTELASTALTADGLWRAALSGFSGLFGRPIPMFSFGMQIALHGLDPFPMKIFNLVVHGLTGVVVYFLAAALFMRMRAISSVYLAPRLAGGVAAAIWLLHPLQVTTVSYIVQRMTSLSALFSALAILIYALERNHQQQSPGRWHVSAPLIVVAGLLAALSKETGLLIPGYLLVAEIFLFHFAAQRRADRLAVIALHASFVGAVLIAGTYFLWRYPEATLGGYPGRTFTMAERLLTESRALIWYLGMILAPDISQMTLYHDDFAISRSLLSPPTTLACILALLLLALSGWIARRRIPWLGFGVCFFLGGHLLESTILPLELVYEHRNYLPAFGVIFAGVAALDRFIAGMSRGKQQLVGAIAVLGIVMLAVATNVRAYVWSGARGATLVDAQNQPQSPRANIAAGIRYAGFAKGSRDEGEKRRFQQLAEQHYRRAVELVPDSPNGILALLLMKYELRTEPPAEVSTELLDRLLHGRIDASTVNGLQAMTDCKIDGVCRMSDEYYLQAMDAAYSNPDILDVYASNLLRCMARYYSESRQDYDTSILLTKRAMELNPTQIGVRLELIQDLAQGGYVASALEELDVLQRQDTLGKYHGTIASWRMQIEGARTVD